MALEDLDITENWQDLEVLFEEQLHTAMLDIENFINTNVKLNFQQLGLDVFGNTYEFNNDGVATLPTPLIDLIAQLDQDEEINGAWTFKDTVQFEQPISSSSTISSSAQPRTKAFRDVSNQSIPNNTFTAVNLNSEAYDIGSLHDNVVNPQRFTVPSGAGGSYSFKAQAVFAANNTGYRQAVIRKNGSLFAVVYDGAPSATADSSIQVAVDDEASVGDYYEFYVFQNSGGALDLLENVELTFFSCRKVW